MDRLHLLRHPVPGSIIGATHSVFFKSIVEEFGWSRTAFSAVFSVNAVIGALLAPLWGRLVDRHGPRGVVPLGAAMVGLSMVLLSNMRSMLEAYLLYILLASEPVGSRSSR